MRPLTIALLFVLADLSVIAQQPTLRVVVIEGEDAVNIIQQKTAVRPVVEVRDRNNLPVPGAVVTFSISGGHAAFGGASSLTVATNAAGQAAVTSLTPSAAGAFQIQVSAAFQGQVATATIAQTNVLTAAQAAAAGAASGGGAGGAGGGASGSAGGAAGGAGGGMSATTIGIVGAAVAGGAVAATQVVNKDDGETRRNEEVFSGPMNGTLANTIVSRNSGSVCTISRAINATAKLILDVNTPTSVSGRIDMNGSDSIVSQTCQVLSSPSMFTATADISGTQASIRGQRGDSGTNAGPNGESIQTTTTVTFEGSINGSTVTGTVRFDQKGVSTGAGGGPVDSTTTGTFPVTLQKQ